MVVLARYEDTNIEIAQTIINYARTLGFNPGILGEQGEAEILLTELDAIGYIESIQYPILWGTEGLVTLSDEREIIEYMSAIKQMPLRLMGYRFIARLNETYIILAPIDTTSYMLFRETSVEDDTTPQIRGRFYKFVKPVTQEVDPLAYLLATQEDTNRKKRLEKFEKEKEE